MSLTLPAFASFSPLEIGQEYRWELALIYESQERVASDGKIKRVEADPTLALRAQEATPQERVALYADKRLWYNALTTLVELRRDRPNDKELEDALDKLLKSAGLNSVGMNIISQQAGN
jgi:predicted N-formylglutamate amidohydrolase